MGTWRRIAEERRKNEEQRNVSNAIKKDTLQRTGRESKR